MHNALLPDFLSILLCYKIVCYLIQILLQLLQLLNPILISFDSGLSVFIKYNSYKLRCLLRRSDIRDQWMLCDMVLHEWYSYI